jgi:hypothetical protein
VERKHLNKNPPSAGFFISTCNTDKLSAKAVAGGGGRLIRWGRYG